MCQTCCNANAMKGWGVVTALLSIAFFTVGIFLPGYINRTLSNGIDDAIVVDAQSKADQDDSYRHWVDPTSDGATVVHYKTYLFHITNAPQVLGGAKPDIVEKGPYTYRKDVFKLNVTYFRNVYEQDQVQFQRQTRYTFWPEMSCTGCTEDDMVTGLNLAFWGLKGPSQGQLFYVYNAAGSNADYLRYFMTKKVSEWMFGYDDQIITGLHAAYPCCTPTRIDGLIGPNEPQFNPAQKFDVLYVGTAPDQQLIRQYDQYEQKQYLETVSFTPPATVTSRLTWRTPAANRVTGTDGTQYPRYIQDGQTVQAYVNQLRRVVTLGNINNEHLTLKGIDVLHFTIPRAFLLNSTNNPLSGDFYMNGFNGVANLTAVGKPDFYVSKPHFLDADQEAFDALTGSNWTPGTKDEHDTFLDIEPLSGATMRAAKRLQLNIRIQPIVTAYQNTTSGAIVPQSWGPGVKVTTVPVYWAEEGAEISDDDASTFKSKVYGAQRASQGIYIAGEAVGAFMAVLTVVLFWVSSNKAASGGTTDNKGAIPL